MELRGISQESLLSIFEQLFKEGKLTARDLEHALKANPTSEIMRLTDLLHAMLCNQSHGQHPDSCDYYTEGQLDKTWERDVHKRWLGIAGRISSAYNISETDIQAINTATGPLIQVIMGMDPIKSDFCVQYVIRRMRDYLHRSVVDLPPIGDIIAGEGLEELLTQLSAEEASASSPQ